MVRAAMAAASAAFYGTVTSRSLAFAAKFAVFAKPVLAPTVAVVRAAQVRAVPAVAAAAGTAAETATEQAAAKVVSSFRELARRTARGFARTVRANKNMNHLQVNSQQRPARLMQERQLA